MKAKYIIGTSVHRIQSGWFGATTSKLFENTPTWTMLLGSYLEGHV